MNLSLFSKIYKYKQTESKNNLENYTTEIFAFCLENDIEFRESFLAKISDKIEPKAGFQVQAQAYYEADIPDVKIIVGNIIILIECKIEAKEGSDQLPSYKKILKDEENKTLGEDGYLVYLTKYKEENKDKEIVYLTWQDIAEMINDSSEKITKIFKNFLMETGSAIDIIKFNQTGLLGLKSFSETIRQMDYVLDAVNEIKIDKAKFVNSKDRSIKQLLSNCYFDETEYKHSELQISFKLQIGFMWWWKNEITEQAHNSDNMRLLIRVFVDNKSYEYYKNEITSYKDECNPSIWEKIEGISLGYALVLDDEKAPITDIQEMTKFLKESLPKIGEIIKILDK